MKLAENEPSIKYTQDDVDSVRRMKELTILLIGQARDADDHVEVARLSGQRDTFAKMITDMIGHLSLSLPVPDVALSHPDDSPGQKEALRFLPQIVAASAAGDTAKVRRISMKLARLANAGGGRQRDRSRTSTGTRPIFQRPRAGRTPRRVQRTATVVRGGDSGDGDPAQEEPPGYCSARSDGCAS